MYLSGYTPRPLDRFGRAQKDIAKTALGAETYISWTSAKDPFALVRSLRIKGYSIVGVEQDTRSVDYRSHIRRMPTLFVFGNEVRGLSKRLRDACDTLVHIPMRGKKESLNVSVAAGVILFNTRTR